MKWLLRLPAAVILIIALAYLALLIARPARTDNTRQLFQGVRYTRQARTAPRPLMVHIVEVDLAAPGIDFLVTPGDEASQFDLFARTTGGFLEEFELQVAINGSFFDPFRAGTPWSYYPYSGDPVNVKGLAISNGKTYSTDYRRFPVLCLSDGLARIERGSCPSDTDQAIAGNQFLVRNGRTVLNRRRDALHPRTAVAVDESGRRLWLVVVDGRQRFYSQGVTRAELADLLVELGASTAINLDGGGSTSLVMAEGGRARSLNAPIHTRIPMRQRPIANHLGLYARPVE